jgi:hypothetical protein
MKPNIQVTEGQAWQRGRASRSFGFTTTPALDSIVMALVVHFVLVLIAGNKISGPKKASA